MFQYVCVTGLICVSHFCQVYTEEAVSLHKLMISFHFTLFPQMLGEQFTPRHTLQRKWCSCSEVKVSLPSWPPSSRSPLHQESYSPSTSQNTGNPSIILFILACSSFSAQLPRITECSRFKLNPEMNCHLTHSCLQMAVDEV